jgi:hypothetical protein
MDNNFGNSVEPTDVKLFELSVEEEDDADLLKMFQPVWRLMLLSTESTPT